MIDLGLDDDDWYGGDDNILPEKIAVDAIKCNKCGDIIYSKYTHDYVKCKCGLVAIDGGREYTRICGDSQDYTMMQIQI